MIYGDVCSGVSAPTIAWQSLGWKAAFYSEIEPFPCKVLQHYYPDVPNLGNMLNVVTNETFINAKLDLLVGGTPCQSFSVAGLRKGLADDRGNLALEYCRLLWTKRQQGRPIRWFLWENVPGALSSYSDETGEAPEETSDFAAILSAFRECGYSCAWRVFDAQYFGVPQRRRRLFVIGYFGNDWRPPAAVLFEPESLSGDTAQGGKTSKETAATLTQRPYADGKQNGTLIPCWWDGGQISQTLDRVLSKGQMMPEKNRFPVILCYPYNQIGSKECRSNPQPGDPCFTLTKREGGPLLVPMLRRLTPLECERLQGFPDNYTNVAGASDTVRYQAIGNSMAVPVMQWIGQRIDTIDKYLTLISS